MSMFFDSPHFFHRWIALHMGSVVCISAWTAVALFSGNWDAGSAASLGVRTVVMLLLSLVSFHSFSGLVSDIQSEFTGVSWALNENKDLKLS